MTRCATQLQEGVSVLTDQMFQRKDGNLPTGAGGGLRAEDGSGGSLSNNEHWAGGWYLLYIYVHTHKYTHIYICLDKWYNHFISIEFCCF